MAPPPRPPHRLPWLLLALLVVLAAPAGARADEDDGAAEEAETPRRDVVMDRVWLENGACLEGFIEEETPERIVLGLPSASGGSGRMVIPRATVRRIERAAERPVARVAPASVRDAFFLLRSAGATIGTRHLGLRHVRGVHGAGWRLEERLRFFARGPHVPATTIWRKEEVDLAFHPHHVHYREVGEASSEPAGVDRYELIRTGEVAAGAWHPVVRTGDVVERSTVGLPEGVRARLGTREHLLRQRQLGLVRVTLLDAASGSLVEVRAGYTALDVPDGDGGTYDEFVWEEGEARQVSRFADASVLEETIAEGVVAVPVTQAQAEAAETRAREGVAAGESGLETLPEIGIAFRIPGDTWALERAATPHEGRGWRKVASLASAYHVADVRIEWDPDGAAAAAGPAEAEARLLQRLRAVPSCQDLRIEDGRRPLEGVEGAWRMHLVCTLRGETVHTIAAWLPRGRARVLLLAAAPEASWPAARTAFETFLASLRWL